MRRVSNLKGETQHHFFLCTFKTDHHVSQRPRGNSDSCQKHSLSPLWVMCYREKKHNKKKSVMNYKLFWHLRWISISFYFIIHRAGIFKAVFHMSKLKHVLQTEFISHRIGPKSNIYIEIFQFSAQIIMLDKCPCFHCGLTAQICHSDIHILDFYNQM